MNRGNNIDAAAVIRRVAQRHGLSTDDVRREMQAALDEARATADPAAKQRQQELFPDGWPSLEQFIARVAAELQP